MTFKQGYRLATMEEREFLNAKGLCWIVRDMGDKALACPNPRVPESVACFHHLPMDKDYEPVEEIPKRVSVLDQIKRLPDEVEDRISQGFADAYKEALAGG